MGDDIIVISETEGIENRRNVFPFPISDPPTVEDVAKVLELVFRAPNSRLQKAANAWVVKFESSVAGWKLSRNLLTSQIPEVQQFGAQIILQKVKLSWASLDEKTILSLPASLLRIVSEGTKHGMFTRLTLLTVADALAICFVRGVLGNGNFTVEQTSAMKRALFSLRSNAFTGLIECLSEMANQTVTLSSTWSREHASKVRAELKTLTKEMLVTVKWVLSNEAPPSVTESLKNDAIRCLQNWLLFGIPSEFMSEMSDFFLGTFRFLHSPTTFETAVDVIDQVMSLKVRHVPTIHSYVRQVVGLKPMFLSAKDEDDHGVSVGIARLATRCGEQYIAQMINKEITVGDSNALCKLLVECAHHPAPDVASLTFKFWTQFGAALLHASADARNHFTPYFQQVLQRVLSQSAYSRDSSPDLGSWNPVSFFMAHDEVDEEWRQFRACAVDPLQACLDLIGPAKVLGFLLQVWEKHGDQASSHWHVLESILFAAATVSPKISIEQARDLPGLKQLLSRAIKVCWSHPLLSRATCELLGESARWLKDNPSLHEHVLKFLFGAIQRDVLSLLAAQALKDIAKECGSQLSPKLPGIMGHMQKSLIPFLNRQISSQPSSAQRSLREAKAHLFNFIVIIAKTSDAQATENVIAWITSEAVSNLKSVLQPSSSSSSSSSRHTVEFDLQRGEHQSLSALASQEMIEDAVLCELTVLTNVYRHFIMGTTSDTAARYVLPSARRVWPLFEVITQKWHGNEDIVEALSGVYSAIWQSCKNRSLSITPGMISKLLNSFERWRFPFCLSALQRAVSSLGQDKAHPDRWQSITMRVLSLVLSKLSAETLTSSGSVSSLSARLQPHHELLSAFFPFLEAVTSYSPQSFAKVPPSGMKSLFSLTVAGMLIGDQENTTKGAVLFLIGILRFRATPLYAMIAPHIPNLLRSTLIFCTRAAVSPPVQKLCVRLLEQFLAVDEQNVRLALKKARSNLDIEPQNTVFNAFFNGNK